MSHEQTGQFRAGTDGNTLTAREESGGFRQGFPRLTAGRAEPDSGARVPVPGSGVPQCAGAAAPQPAQWPTQPRSAGGPPGTPPRHPQRGGRRHLSEHNLQLHCSAARAGSVPALVSPASVGGITGDLVSPAVGGITKSFHYFDGA